MWYNLNTFYTLWEVCNNTSYILLSYTIFTVEEFIKPDERLKRYIEYMVGKVEPRDI